MRYLCSKRSLVVRIKFISFFIAIYSRLYSVVLQYSLRFLKDEHTYRVILLPVCRLSLIKNFNSYP